MDKKENEKEKTKSREDNNADLVSQKSIRVLPKMVINEDDHGEKLQECTEGEWDASDQPFSAELLNVKNAPNRVTVFSGPCRTNQPVQTITKMKPTTSPNAETPPDDRADKLALMMDRVFSELIDGRDLSQIKVTICTKLQ